MMQQFFVSHDSNTEEYTFTNKILTPVKKENLNIVKCISGHLYGVYVEADNIDNVTLTGIALIAMAKLIKVLYNQLKLPEETIIKLILDNYKCLVSAEYIKELVK